jgi:large subunit ribosomal protein L24
MKIKKGDNIIVLTGKDKGKTGKVSRALPNNGTVIVEGVNLMKRHQKTNRQTSQGGGIIEKAMPLDVSNVALVDPKIGKATRVAKKFDEAKKKWVRVTKKSGTVLA